MRGYLKQYDKDYMKMAMLKQEETFRQQVHELHRLYRIQKLLMNEMKSELRKQRKSLNIDSNRAIQALDLKLPAEDKAGRKDDDDEEGGGGEESDLELTLATGSRRIRSSRRTRKEKEKEKEKENSFTSDSGVSLSSISTESGSEKPTGNHWGLFQMSSHETERMKESPWLLQCLSLKMT